MGLLATRHYYSPTPHIVRTYTIAGVLGLSRAILSIFG